MPVNLSYIWTYVNPADCINAAIAWQQDNYMVLAYGQMEATPTTYKGNRAIHIAEGPVVGAPEALFVCLSLLESERIPAAYAAIPNQWDTYQTDLRAGEAYYPPAIIAELFWYAVAEWKKEVIEAWTTAGVTEGEVNITNYLDNAIYSYEIPFQINGGGRSASVTNIFWFNNGYEGVDEPMLHEVAGMIPMGASAAGSVASVTGLSSVVRALMDMAHTTRVTQINNRGSIADISSGDIITPPPPIVPG